MEDDQNNVGEWSRDILEDTAEAVDRLLKVLPSNEECKGIWHWYQDTKKRGEDFNPRVQFGIAERFCLSAHEIVGSSTRLASKLRATRFKLEFDIVQDLVKDKVRGQGVVMEALVHWGRGPLIPIAPIIPRVDFSRLSLPIDGSH